MYFPCIQMMILMIGHLTAMASSRAGTSAPRSSGFAMATTHQLLNGFHHEPYSVTTIDHSIITVEGEEKRLLMLGTYICMYVCMYVCICLLLFFQLTLSIMSQALPLHLST